MAGVVRYEVGKRMSEASKYNGIIHLAGQVADDASQDITGQTKQVLAQVDRLLAQAGSHKSNILMTQIFLSDVASQFAAMNAVYDAWVVPGHTAPRATRFFYGSDSLRSAARNQVQAALADPTWLIEVVVTAAEGAPAS